MEFVLFKSYYKKLIKILQFVIFSEMVSERVRYISVFSLSFYFFPIFSNIVALNPLNPTPLVFPVIIDLIIPMCYSFMSVFFFLCLCLLFPLYFFQSSLFFLSVISINKTENVEGPNIEFRLQADEQKRGNLKNLVELMQRN